MRCLSSLIHIWNVRRLKNSLKFGVVYILSNMSHNASEFRLVFKPHASFLRPVLLKFHGSAKKPNPAFWINIYTSSIIKMTITSYWNFVLECTLRLCVIHVLDVPYMLYSLSRKSFQWRHNDHDGVSNHQPHGCLFNRLFRRWSTKTSKLRGTGFVWAIHRYRWIPRTKGQLRGKCVHLMTSSFILSQGISSMWINSSIQQKN